MNRLHVLQDQFQEYLLTGKSDIQTSIVSTKNVSADTRLAIYSNAYQARLIDGLASNYPVLASYLGDEIFEMLATEYLQLYPSLQPSIRWFGDQFAPFLQRHAIYQFHPYLAELAQFEWTQTLVFDAADSDLLTMEEIVQLSPSLWVDMRLQTHPSVYRLNFSWNVVAIWQAVSEGQCVPEPEQSTSPTQWLLWRKEYINQFRSLTEDEAWAIDGIFNQLSFGQLCEGLCQWIDEDSAGQRAAALLKEWIYVGLLNGIRIC